MDTVTTVHRYRYRFTAITDIPGACTVGGTCTRMHSCQVPFYLPTDMGSPFCIILVLLPPACIPRGGKRYKWVHSGNWAGTICFLSFPAFCVPTWEVHWCTLPACRTHRFLPPAEFSLCNRFLHTTCHHFCRLHCVFIFYLPVWSAFLGDTWVPPWGPLTKPSPACLPAYQEILCHFLHNFTIL